MPSSIDATGSKAASAPLQSVIDEAPDGATIVFEADGVYLLDRALWVADRRDLTLDGNGARLTMPKVDQGYNSIGIRVHDSVNTTIRDFILVGPNAKAGTSKAFSTERENNHAIALLGAKDTLIEDVTIRRPFGDCLYIGPAYGTGVWTDGVTFRDSTCRLTGRIGVTTIAGKHILVERVAFDEIGSAIFGMEPNLSSEGANDVTYRDNTIGSFGLNELYESYLFYASGAEGSSINNVTFHNNQVQGNPNGGYGGHRHGLDIIVNGERGPREGYTVTDNTSETIDQGPTMIFKSVKGVTVTGNVQPLSSGELATFPGSKSVTYGDNVTSE